MQNYNKNFDFPLFSCNFVPVKLSVIIPVYRSEATLERCLRTIMGQTFYDFEIILVDDGSPDSSPQLCDKCAKRDSRIKVIHKQNGGLSDARNAALEVAQGTFVTFVDADDYLDTYTYEEVLPWAETCDIVEFPILCHAGYHNQYLFTPEWQTYTRAEDYWLQGHAYEHSYACNKIYRRELFEHVRYPVGRVFEDMATLPILIEKAHSIMTVTYGCYFYVANAHGITATANGTQLEMLLESHIETMKQWVDDRYYMHVLNIQLDVARLTQKAPILPRRHIAWFSRELSFRLRVKAWLLNIFGIKLLCKIHRTIIHR